MDAVARTPVRLALATGMFDDASMYPPARAPMEAALSLHATVASSPWAVAQGRFLCPGAQLRRLADERSLLGLSGRLEVGAVVGSPADPGAASELPDVAAAAAELDRSSPGVRVSAIEIRPGAPSPGDVQRAADEAADLAMRTDMDQVAVEVVVTDADAAEIDARVHAVADARHRHGPRICAKIRCGGLDPSMVPSFAQLAAFVRACADRDLPFKATAGLHHGLAVADGPDRRHGFLNLTVAAAHAAGGAAPEALAGLLAVDDPEAVDASERTLRFADVDLDVTAIEHARRRSFLSFGTCSFTEPLTDLLTLT